MVKGLLAAGADIVSIQIDNDDVAIREAKAHGRTGAVYVADLANKEDVAGLFPRILADGHNPTAFIAW
jgi:2-deoxy-D-gluconate 3-dehydrogenase